jgi:formate hydrogenlyase subunit 4
MLFTKENIIPENSIPWIFNLAPLIGLVVTISILLYLPIGGFEPLVSSNGDLILILYLLIIPSLAMVIGGFASGSPYATVGAQREMATMIAVRTWFFKRSGSLSLTLGPVLFWWILAMLTSLYLPGFNIVLLWPILFSLYH